MARVLGLEAVVHAEGQPAIALCTAAHQAFESSLSRSRLEIKYIVSSFVILLLLHPSSKPFL
jgi:hypothetical protein